MGGQYSEVDGGEGLAAAKGGKKGAKKGAVDSNAPSGPLVELFNIKSDPNEKTNLATKEPARVKELQTRLDAYTKAAVPTKQARSRRGLKVPTVWDEQ